MYVVFLITGVMVYGRREKDTVRMCVCMYACVSVYLYVLRPCKTKFRLKSNLFENTYFVEVK